MNSASATGMPDTLPPCPNTPNCVSSQAGDTEHFIAPIAYTGESETAMRRLQAILDGMPRGTPVARNGDYLHYEFRSLVFRFVDDFECLLDTGHSVIQVRSAARVGRSDFGVNRRRVERVRAAFAAHDK